MIRPLDLSEWWRNGLVFVALLFSVSANVKAQTVQPAQAVQPTTRPAAVYRLTRRQQRHLIRYNEAGAVMMLRTLHSSEATYQATTGNGNYGTIAELRKEGLIDYVLAEGHRYGYLFRIRQEKISSESPQASFEIVAVPRTYGRTGRRSFYVDESGVIRYADKKGAEANPEDNMLVIDP
jgi:hypothetical protein